MEIENRKVYSWQEHSGEQYVPSTSAFELVTVQQFNFNDLFEFEYDHFADFNRKYVQVRIATRAKKAIDILTDRFGVDNGSGRLYLLSCVLQDIYSRYYMNPMDSVKDGTEDFEKLILDETKLMHVMHHHIKNPSHYNPPKQVSNKTSNQFEEITSITFKATSTFKISNPLVIRDILNAIADRYNLNFDNFDSKKEEILDNSGNVIFKKLDEFIKSQIIIGLYKLLGGKQIEKPSNHELTFIGLFLNTTQIPIYKENEVNYENEIGLEDIASLRHYFKRDKKLFVTRRNKNSDL